jgi:hypothetical protein
MSSVLQQNVENSKETNTMHDLALEKQTENIFLISFSQHFKAEARSNHI